MNKLLSIIFLSSFLGACGISKYIPDMPDLSLPSIPSIKPYKADVRQGSVLTRFAINQLKTGMSKRQVQDIIGQPSILDPFHNNQWNYIHYTTLGSGEIINYRLILTFTADKLTNINTDGIRSLPKMTKKEQIKQAERLNKEKSKTKEEGLLLMKEITGE
ncbi:outer membrane protein assembly factor BamE [Bathymodiolus septemdierum thioautotrophic gill symbiont]|uniref:Outer membrane protein assembly factor BamE n=1 Tax=endosymbiont of Bathymodiolus septemdierum str. Myojin knoll TaxID=1303921 RepID=A0A0P0USE3_9GAMM|nr:outer membrane protein assembly factor BamE [Bathymodiolus septemdierum thioautotrophic gill symbiont]BAS68073.1 small protein A [endosymbiont of Bathymodiolus septemdierum str. Myojin knoll]